MAIIAPSGPTQRSQPSETPASMLTRLAQLGGRTASRYAAGCAAKRSQQGIDTTRVRMPSASSVVAGGHGQRQLRAGRDEDEVRLRGDAACVLGVGQDIAAASKALRGQLGRAWQDGQLLPRQGERHRPVGSLDREPPGGHGLVRVTGPHEPQVGHGAQCGVMLDRFVRRPVLAEPDGVVGPDVGHRQPGQRREANRTAHVVAEVQERARVRDGSRRGTRCRWRWRPWRARGRRSAGSVRRRRPRSRRRP